MAITFSWFSSSFSSSSSRPLKSPHSGKGDSRKAHGTLWRNEVTKVTPQHTKFGVWLDRMDPFQSPRYVQLFASFCSNMNSMDMSKGVILHPAVSESMDGMFFRYLQIKHLNIHRLSSTTTERRKKTKQQHLNQPFLKMKLWDNPHFFTLPPGVFKHDRNLRQNRNLPHCLQQLATRWRRYVLQRPHWRTNLQDKGDGHGAGGCCCWCCCCCSHTDMTCLSIVFKQLALRLKS